MHAFTCLAVSALAAVAAAGSDANPFNIPSGGYTFTVGKATTLTWNPTTSGTVSLRLQHGEVTTATGGTAIASDINNDGTYTWTVPSDVTTEPYTIEIISDEDSDDYNFLPRFTIAGATAAATTSSAATTSATPTTTSESTTSTSSTSTSTSSSAATTMTTMTTATSSSASSSSSAASTSDSSSTSTSDSGSSTTASASSSSTSVPATNAGLVNRVSGGMMALVAGAMAVL